MAERKNNLELSNLTFSGQDRRSNTRPAWFIFPLRVLDQRYVPEVPC